MLYNKCCRFYEDMIYMCFYPHVIMTNKLYQNKANVVQYGILSITDETG